MITFILLTLVLTTTIALGTAGTIRHDGYGSRPAPRSHHDAFPTQLPH